MWWVSLSLGLLSSLHCLGMCGPIALAIPVRSSNYYVRLFAILLYNFGRVSVYVLFGVIAGLFGKVFSFSGYQQGLSITMGCVILLVLFFPRMTNSFGSKKLSEWIRNAFSPLVNKKTYSSYWLLGMLNGFLPCGMVYIAVAGAVATGNVSDALAFMLFFGLGTMPMMVFLMHLKDLFSVNVRSQLRRLVPFIAGAMAVLFILRGLDLGIPYVSPKADPVTGIHACCHKQQMITSHCSQK
jgi:uncharacterized protein